MLTLTSQEMSPAPNHFQIVLWSISITQSSNPKPIRLRLRTQARQRWFLIHTLSCPASWMIRLLTALRIRLDIVRDLMHLISQLIMLLMGAYLSRSIFGIIRVISRGRFMNILQMPLAPSWMIKAADRYLRLLGSEPFIFQSLLSQVLYSGEHIHVT